MDDCGSIPGRGNDFSHCYSGETSPAVHPTSYLMSRGFYLVEVARAES
jgi:hypothetical protein